jgi:predicted TIM-barrel fold metal-dependent hydrolase
MGIALHEKETPLLSTPPGASDTGIIDTGLIDTDIHHSYRSVNDLLPFLPEPWKGQVARGRGLGATHGYVSPIGVNREDARPPSGGPPGSDPAFLTQHHLQRYGIAKGILNPAGIISISCNPDPDFAVAGCAAYNDWLLQSDWLNGNDSYYGAMLVATQDPERAAREIERIGDHPRIASVLMTSASTTPYGQRKFWAIYEAAERKGLPVTIHPGAEGAGISGAPTGVGWPASYFEWHTDLSQGYMGHTVSLIAEGVFQKFPNLKFVLIEGGIGWMPHLMWRMDKNYKALRQLVPWLNEMPSAVMRRHIRLTTQPIEEPENPKHLLNIFDMLGSDEMVMFSSDYPHWDFDDPIAALRHLPDSLKLRLFRENALATYNRLPS